MGYCTRFVRISETGTGLYILPWWRLPLCPSRSQPAVSEYGWGSTGVNTGGHRYCSCVFGAVEIRGIHESGMGPYLPRVRRKCPPLISLYPPRTGRCGARTNQRLANGIEVFSPRRVVSTRESSVCFPG